MPTRSDPHAFDFARRVIVDGDRDWLARAIDDAAGGRFPDPDHAIRIVPAVEGPLGAVVAFTGHHVIASPLDASEVAEEIERRGVRLPTDPRFLGWLAERLGAESSGDTVDVVLARRGISRRDHPPMQPADNRLLDDARVAFAVETRREPLVFAPADESGIVILAAGLCGRLEVSIELAPQARASGRAREIVDVALAQAGEDQMVFAQVSAGNSAALRAALACGFAPICGEFLIR